MVAMDERCQEPPREDGDPEAFATVVIEHQRMIHSLCYRMTGSLADADDLAQETFIQAYQHWSEFREESRVSSWLYRIALNRCLNWRSRQVRRERLHREWSQQEQAEPGDVTAGCSEQIQQALMKLDPKQRAAVVLTTYEGLNHSEAGKLLGCSETTVSWRLFRARIKLKRLLAPMKASGDGK